MEIKNNIDLRPYNSFGVPARATRFAEVAGCDDLVELFARDELRNGQWMVLGGGNNILFTKDYDGTIIHPVGRSLSVVAEDESSLTVHVEAGVDWDDFVEWATERDLWGIENLSYIPGTVGASPVQNIGAYGAEAADCIVSVEMFCVEQSNMLTLQAEHCEFGYRDSIFKHTLKGKVVVTAVNFKLSKIPAPRLSYGDVEERVSRYEDGTTLHNIRKVIIEIRREKLPDPKAIGNAGSFFKNPVVDKSVAQRILKLYPKVPLYPTHDPDKMKISAAWMIDSCGWKGLSLGPVGVHPRQALVLVNKGFATGVDVIALSDAIRKDVAEVFGIDIEPEVNIV